MIDLSSDVDQIPTLPFWLAYANAILRRRVTICARYCPASGAGLCGCLQKRAEARRRRQEGE